MSRLRRSSDTTRIEGTLDGSETTTSIGADRRVWVWMAAIVLCLSVLFHGGDIGWSDGMSMYQVTRSIVEDGDVAIELGVVWEGADGRYYSPFGIGLSVVALPVYAAVRIVRVVLPVPEQFSQALVSLLSPLFLAMVAVAVYRLARRLGAGVSSSVVVGLGGVFGTFVLIYGKAFWSEPLAALFVTLAIERTVARAPIAAGAAAAGAALTRPQLFLFAPIVLWGLWRRGGARDAGQALVPLGVATLVQVGYNVLRWGDPLNFGYSGTEVPQGFTTPILEGIGGLLFHPQKSVLLFAPIVLLVPFGLLELWSRGSRIAFWMIAGNLVIAFVLSATWWDWGGGFTWGPRLLIPGLIPAVGAIAPWADRTSGRRHVIIFLFALGALVSVPSLAVGGGAQLADSPRPQEGPSIVRQYGLLPQTIAYTSGHLYEVPRGRDPSRTLDLWQVGVAWRLGPKGLVASAFVSCVTVIAAVLAIRRLRREVWQIRRTADVDGTGSSDTPGDSRSIGSSTKDR